MNKENKIKMVKSHHKFFSLCMKICNGLKFNNKLHSKGCKVSIGVSKINGLKIISHGNNNKIIIGDFVKIKNSFIVLKGDNNKIIINDFSTLNQVELCTEDSNNEISIGSNTNFCGKAHLAAIEGTKIKIGNRCLFSSDLQFRTGDSHSILNMQGDRINPSKNIIIDDHVWFGAKVTCLKGVHISKDSIVAATTTLCKDYDKSNVIIAGIPGKIIKTDINWSIDRI